MIVDVSLPECEVAYNVPLRDHSYWKIGGNAAIFVVPKTVKGLVNALTVLNNKEIPILIIGSGTNLLFDDSGVSGAVIKIGSNLSGVSIKGNEVIVESGIFVPFLARITQSHSLSGIEHTVGIPGTLGGLVSMNGGSQRKGIGDNIEWVEAIDFKGNIHRIQKEDCGFGYRKSIFQERDLIILRVKLVLKKGDRNTIRNEMLDILVSRNKRFPRKLPSCGSVFLSSPEVYAKMGAPGLVTESLGLKGYRLGEAEISPRHANFIVNLGKASHFDVLGLVKLINSKCMSEYGFQMDAEAKYITPEGKQIPLHLVTE